MIIISQIHIDKKLAELGSKPQEELQQLMGTPTMMYGTELPFYFLYQDVDGAEGAKQTHARLLDLVMNRDDITKPYMTGDIAIPLDIDGFYSVLSGVNICIIQAETPDEEQHHSVVLLEEIDKVFTILSETIAAGKEVTIKFHAKPEFSQEEMLATRDTAKALIKGD